MLLVALYFAMSTLAADCQPDGDHAAICKSGSCEMVSGAEICTQCKAGGVPIDGFCWPVNSPQVITAGCTGPEGTLLDSTATTCGTCGGADHFLFMGGCYSQKNRIGGTICTKAVEGKCTTCKVDSKYLFQNPANPATPGNECVLCSDIRGDGTTKGVENCAECTKPNAAGAATCSKCKAGYAKKENACVQCGEGCSECSADTPAQCTACFNGKYLNTNTCVDSNQCPSGTYADSYSGKCETCAAGTSGGSDQTIAGITDCTICSLDEANKRLVCSGCGGGKLLKTDATGATSCVDSGTCVTDYFSEGSECVLCGNEEKGGVAGCKSCSKKDTCTACLAGYFDSGTPKCTACSENCLTCNNADAGQCTKCKPGYFVQGGGTGTCTACGANCATCDEAGDDKCKSCKIGFFLVGSPKGACIVCDDKLSKGIEGCSKCEATGPGNPPKCTSCKDNYHHEPGSAGAVTCKKFCEDPTACGGTAGACEAIVVQDNGDFLHYCSLCGDLKTFPINGICTGTKGDNTCANSVCTQCAAGYFLYMGGCYSATSAPGNLMCKEAPNGVCIAPSENNKYFLVPGAASNQQSVMACENPLGTAVGEKAYVGVEGCDTCTAPAPLTEAGMRPARCTACNSGGKPNLAGSGCFSCTVGGCSHCSANEVCEACTNKEQRPNTAGTQCISCNIDGCTRCSEENKCDQCGDGYRLEGEACIATKPSGGNRSGLSTGAIAGIAVAAIVVVGGLVGFLCWWFLCRGKA
ncbi:VSP [Giardia lamblia P15]|uniref:VSP n=1 Tax=Giardia intestinalis (strain P15) TaxID=658858 RepID=E1F459_GIAIA|nr:VSP [Giardia lamblia P15]